MAANDVLIEALNLLEYSIERIEGEWGRGKTIEELRQLGDEEIVLLDAARAALTPRVVTTLAGLQALPDGTIGRSADGYAVTFKGDRVYGSQMAVNMALFARRAERMPVIVLSTPEVN